MHLQYGGSSVQPAPSPPRRIFYPAQPPYLINNWRATQAQNEYQDYTKYVRVIGGVASITNGGVLIRSHVDAPDGFYVITADRGLRDVIPEFGMYSSKSFPDVEAFRPPFQNMDISLPIYREEITSLLGFLNFLREGKDDVNCSSRVHMDHRTIADTKNSDRFYTFSCELPVKFDGLIFDATNLKLAFTEMLRYDCIHVWRDNSPSGYPPLVIGLDWDRCVLVEVERSKW